MFFSKSKSCCTEPDVVIDGERLQVVSDFKYLGVYCILIAILLLDHILRKYAITLSSTWQILDMPVAACQLRLRRCLCIQ